ncbi:hypothetical protein LCGC14_1744990 [marine sediment metagenome]|uniref:Uncharacterized protein n=1 Tax=marine sediment metagenome TaxID=412755 RepID=A0A0F9H5I8_9ZZZZ
MHKWIVPIERLSITDKQGDWCRLPYPNHPRGCPNYAHPKHPECPPTAKPVDETIDVSRPMFLVHSVFDLEAHIERMAGLHPKRSELQKRCVLYWQETSRKQMRERAAIAQYEKGTNVILTCPEGSGVNVYATARSHGLKLERIRHLKTCRHVALLGSRRQ